jgi:hypothetical protein
LQTPFHVLRRTDDQIHRERGPKRQADLEGPIELIPCGHYEKQIDVTVHVRLAVGVRAEQNNSVGVELFRQLPREATDYSEGYTRRTAQAHLFGFRRRGRSRTHAPILVRFSRSRLTIGSADSGG